MEREHGQAVAPSLSLCGASNCTRSRLARQSDSTACEITGASDDIVAELEEDDQTCFRVHHFIQR